MPEHRRKPGTRATQGATLVTLALLSACNDSNRPYQIELMPAPDVYEEGSIDPFADATPIDDLPYDGILYATDRLPADNQRNIDLPKQFAAMVPGSLPGCVEVLVQSRHAEIQPHLDDVEAFGGFNERAPKIFPASRALQIQARVANVTALSRGERREQPTETQQSSVKQ